MSTHISDAKLEANRRNAEASTGPRTPEGKQVSKLNRLSHGLASPLAVLPFENQEEYDALLATFTQDYLPVGATEEALVKQIADAQWKLRRLEKLETSVFAALLSRSQNEPTGMSDDPFASIAAALLAPGKGQSALGLLARYQGTLNRQFLSSIKELRGIQKDRKKEYCEEIKSELLHDIAGFPNADAQHRLAFHLISEDPSSIGRYNETAVQILAAQNRKDAA